MKNLFSFAIVSAFVLLPLTLKAQDLGKVAADFRASHQNMVWQFDPAANRYNLESVETHVTGQLKGAGSFVGLSKPIDESRTEIIGQKQDINDKQRVNGQMFLTVQARNNLPALMLSLQVNDVNNGFPIVSEVSYPLPVELLGGSTWRDFQEGRTVRMRTTPAAKGTYNQKMGEFLMTMLQNAFAKGYGGLEVQTKVESVQLAEDIDISANRNEIIMLNMVTDYKMQLTLPY